MACYMKARYYIISEVTCVCYIDSWIDPSGFDFTCSLEADSAPFHFTVVSRRIGLRVVHSPNHRWCSRQIHERKGSCSRSNAHAVDDQVGGFTRRVQPVLPQERAQRGMSTA